MTFRDDLVTRITNYGGQIEALEEWLAYLRELVAHAQALLAEEERQSQVPINLQNGHQEEPSVPQEQEHIEEGAPISVGQAVAAILGEGQARFVDIHHRVASEFPVSVADVSKSVSSALRWGIRTGRYTKQGRGLYRLA